MASNEDAVREDRLRRRRERETDYEDIQKLLKKEMQG